MYTVSHVTRLNKCAWEGTGTQNRIPRSPAAARALWRCPVLSRHEWPSCKGICFSYLTQFSLAARGPSWILSLDHSLTSFILNVDLLGAPRSCGWGFVSGWSCACEMEHEYREILLLTGLEEITKKELQRFKYLVMDEFKISRSQLDETTNRPELADLLIQSAGPASAVTKTIHLFRKLNYMHAAKCLQEQQKKGMWKCLSFNDTRAIKPPECCINLLNHLPWVPSPPCLRGTKNCVANSSAIFVASI